MIIDMKEHEVIQGGNGTSNGFVPVSLYMSLVQTKERSNSERPFKCPLCDYSAKTKYRIKEHIIDHSKSFVCSVCHRGFGRKSSLHQHMVSQHGLHRTLAIKASGKR